MAKKSMIERETKRERLNIQYKHKKSLLKKELRDIKYLQSFQDFLLVLKKMESIPKNSATSRRRNRCWLSGRSRGFYRDFGLSRHSLRELGNEGFLPGLKKSSW